MSRCALCVCAWSGMLLCDSWKAGLSSATSYSALCALNVAIQPQHPVITPSTPLHVCVQAPPSAAAFDQGITLTLANHSITTAEPCDKLRLSGSVHQPKMCTKPSSEWLVCVCACACTCVLVCVVCVLLWCVTGVGGCHRWGVRGGEGFPTGERLGWFQLLWPSWTVTDRQGV